MSQEQLRPTCERCGSTEPPTLRVDAKIDPKDYTPEGGRVLCLRCYEAAR